MNSETSASCKSWPHPFHSLGRTARTVAWTAVGQATDDMDMALGAQIHAEWLKTSNLYPRMRSATKHVHPCTESLASLSTRPCSVIPHFEPLANSPRAKLQTGPRDSVRMVQTKNLFRTPSKSSRSRPRHITKSAASTECLVRACSKTPSPARPAHACIWAFSTMQGTAQVRPRAVLRRA